MIQVGDTLPSATLKEFIEVETEACAIGPKEFNSVQESAGKTVALFALPGAFTPGCSNTHLPSYLSRVDELRQAGVDEIWCVSVNDAFVMGAWGRQQSCAGKIRMMADGSAEFSKALGLTQDLSAKGFGIRSQRYSMLIKDGVVKALHVEAPGQIAISDGQTMLKTATEQKV